MRLSKAKQKQIARILDTLYVQGPTSRIDLSKYLKITPATMSELTQYLIDKKILYELGELEEDIRAGRKKILLDICPHHSYYIGAELFEHSLVLCLMDNKNNIITQESYEFDMIDENKVIQSIQQFNKLDYPISAIGIAIPGHYDPQSDHIITNNPFWKNFSLTSIQNAFQMPVYFENNVNSMAIYERLFGQFKGDINFIFMHFRRGMFSSYVYNSEIYARNNYYVGEIGHMVVNPHGPLCECGKHGCLQTYASQTWLIEKAKRLYFSGNRTYLSTLIQNEKDLTMDILLEAYHLGDSAIIHMIDTAIDYMAIAINNIVVSLDAEIIYLHAELFNDETISQLLLDKINYHDSQFIPSKEIQKIIRPYSRFHGSEAAASLAIYESLLI